MTEDNVRDVCFGYDSYVENILQLYCVHATEIFEV